jgi:hypothetical protein
MKEFIKKSWTTTYSYGAGMFLFLFFLIAPLSMEKNKYIWLTVYSFVFFVFTVSFLYKNIWVTGSSAQLQNKAGKPFLTGLLCGIVGFAPYLLIEALYFIIHPSIAGAISGNALHALFRCAFGPMYFIIRLLGYTWYAYLIASAVIPLVSALGYFAGYRNTNLPDLFFPSGKDEEDFLDI